MSMCTRSAQTPERFEECIKLVYIYFKKIFFIFAYILYLKGLSTTTPGRPLAATAAVEEPPLEPGVLSTRGSRAPERLPRGLCDRCSPVNLPVNLIVNLVNLLVNLIVNLPSTPPHPVLRGHWHWQRRRRRRRHALWSLGMGNLVNQGQPTPMAPQRPQRLF